MKNAKTILLFLFGGLFMLAQEVDALNFNTTQNLTGAVIDWLGDSTVNDIVINPNNDLVYILGSSSSSNTGIFGVFNTTSNTSINLTSKITNSFTGVNVHVDNGIFLGDSLYMTVHDDDINELSLVVYNETLNISSNISLVTGVPNVQDMTRNTRNGLFYILGGQLFVSVNISSDGTVDLRDTIKVGNFGGAEIVGVSIEYDSQNELIYIGGGVGKSR